MVLLSEFGRVGKVKYPSVRKNTHYVFEFFFFPMCISNPNFSKCRISRGVPISNWCLDSNAKSLSLT